MALRWYVQAPDSGAAVALLARDRYPDLVLGTHDEELAIAARAMGFEVVGVATG